MRGLARPVLALLPLLAACAHERGPAPDADRPLAVRIERAGGVTRLVLIAAPGWKINARLKPVLELPDGARLGFDAPRLTPDSAYFAEPPGALVAEPRAGIRGTLRASVCAAGESVCRLATLEVASEQ